MDSLYEDQASVGTSLPSSSLPVSNAMTKFQATIVILLLCVGLGLLGWYIFEISPRAEERIQAGIERIDIISGKINAPIQWEYRVETVPDLSFTQRVNAMGKDSWELVFARRASDGSTYSPVFSYEMIFKRPKKIEATSTEKPTQDGKQTPKQK
jgi:hypothetical protein